MGELSLEKTPLEDSGSKGGFVLEILGCSLRISTLSGYTLSLETVFYRCTWDSREFAAHVFNGGDW